MSATDQQSPDGNPTTDRVTNPADAAAEAALPLIEIGWMLLGDLGADEDTVLEVRETVLTDLRQMFPEFNWQMPVTRQPQFEQAFRETPIRLLDFAVTERDIRRWDFGIVVTAADLISHWKPFAFAAFSTSLGLSVISTSRIDPENSFGPGCETEHGATCRNRIRSLVLHSLGHLIGLDHVDDRTNCMYDFASAADLDAAHNWTAGQIDQARAALLEVSDVRLEEQSELSNAGRLRFSLRSVWTNRREILQAISQGEPWLFPLRLSRLATAAVSAQVVLMITAESWELGMSLPLSTAIGFALFCLLFTSGYVIRRQRVLVRRERNSNREQTVITNVSAVAIITGGMLTTLLGLFVITLVGCLLIFPQSVIVSWAASVKQIGWPQYVALALSIATVGLVIGALGASFEDQNYFRHMTFVDEEI